MICVTMCQYDSHNHVASYPFPLQSRRTVGGWVDHDAPPIYPEHVAADAALLVEPVTVAEDSNPKRWRLEECSGLVGWALIRSYGMPRSPSVTRPCRQIVRLTVTAARH